MHLVGLSGDLTGLVFPLPRQRTSVGRRSDNDVCVPLDPRVSRQHACLVADDGGVLLDDLGSANGTFIEQRRIHEPTRLQPGDRFRVGRTWFQLLDDPATAPDAAAPEVVLVGREAQAADESSGNVVFALDAVRPVEAPDNAAELRQRLQVMVSLAGTLGSTLDLPALLHLAVDEIMRVIRAEQAALLLTDATTGALVPRVARSRAGELAEGELRISQRVVTNALERRLAVLTTDATTDARFLEADSVQDLHIRSAICAPLIARGEAIGAIYLDTSSRSHVFTEQDVRLVAGIAGAIAVAIENAKLYTDLRQAYDALQAAQERLVRSQSVATVGMLAATIAHDMANIVTPIHTFVQIMLSGAPLSAEAQEALRSETERMVALVQRILSFARPSEDAALGQVDANEVVVNTLSMVRTELLRRNIHLERALAEGLPLVTGDGPQLERALLNIVLNAADALDECEEKRITVCTRLEEGEVVVSVRDTGPGIPQEIQERMFEPFFTTKSTGTGLGLFSCRRIIEDEHGGNLELDSRPGAGTTISFWLPVSPMVV
jgi:two-component system, NtrC family, sensor kinase